MEAPIALIYDSRIRALDSSGNPLVGATLTIYDAGTTTPSSIYRDAALSTPMTNPTSGSDVSDSGGWFPQIFAAEGGTYDITLKTSGGVTVKAYVSVPALGTGSGVITRDFGTSRLRIANSGGTVRVEGGDPSGDDVGGKITLGGYSGTQADIVTLDGASAVTTGTLNTGGTLTENSKKLPGVVQTSGTASAAASIIVSVPNTPTGVTSYDIDLSNCFVSAAGSLGVAFSYDNGATYLASSTYATTTDGTTVGGQTAGILLASVNTGLPIAARLRLMTGDTAVGGSNLMSYLFGTAVYTAPHAVSISQQSGVLFRVTNVRFTPSSGTITGNWRVVPLRGTGDA